MADLFAAEEVASTRDYPREYGAASIADQLAALRRTFAALKGSAAEPAAALPAGSEAWFVVPRWHALAATYNDALDVVLQRLARQRPISFARASRLGPAFLRRSERTRDMLDARHRDSSSDVVVLPAQFGLRHRGRSVRRVRELLGQDEFGLGAFEVGCMLLVHPARMARSDQLYVDCAGDEYSASDEQQFSEAPYFRVLDARLGFGTSWNGYVDPYFGSATGFTVSPR